MQKVLLSVRLHRRVHGGNISTGHIKTKGYIKTKDYRLKTRKGHPGMDLVHWAHELHPVCEDDLSESG